MTQTVSKGGNETLSPDRARQIMEGNETRRQDMSSSSLSECHCHATSSGPCLADRSSVKEEDPCYTTKTTAVTRDKNDRIPL